MKRQRTLVKKWCKDSYVTFFKLELEDDLVDILHYLTESEGYEKDSYELQECHSEIREIIGTLLDKVRFEDREREEKNEEETV
jgi:hypothetical protein